MEEPINNTDQINNTNQTVQKEHDRQSESFVKRPLFLCSLSLMITSAMVMYFLPGKTASVIILAIAILIGLTLALFSAIRKSLFMRSAAICALGAIVSLSSFLINLHMAKESVSAKFGRHFVEGYFTDINYNTDSGCAGFFSVTKIDGNKTLFGTYLEIPERIGAEKFDLLSFDCEISEIEESGDGFLTKRNLYSKSVFAFCEAVGNIHMEKRAADGIIPFFGRINNSVCAAISRGLDERSAGLVNALLFGDRSGLGEESVRDFRTLGITHMLVVSGMNIALIAGELETILRLFKIKRTARSIICSLVCLLYMALCGFAFSVVRAALMQVICRVAVIFKRRNDSITSLFFSMAVILTLSPCAIADIGLLLSFFATLGLVTFPQFFKREKKNAEIENKSDKKKETEFANRFKTFLGSLGSDILSSICACVFTLPVCVIVFGEAALMGPFATTMFSAFLDALLFITPIYLILSFIPIIGNIFSALISFMCTGVLDLISLIAYPMRDTLVSAGGIVCEALVIFLIVSIIIPFVVKRGNNLIKAMPALILWLCISTVGMFLGNKDGGIYLRVKDNESIILNSSGNSTLIDISNGSKTFLRSEKGALLSSLGNTNVDNLILTHLHMRHISLVRFLALDGYLSNVFVPECMSDDEKTVAGEIVLLSQKYGFTVTFYDNILEEGEVSVDGFVFKKSLYFTPKTSSHTSVSFTVKRGEEQCLYLSKAVFDSPNLEEMMIDESSVVIFGAHPPKGHNNIPSFALEDGKLFVFANKEIKESIVKLNVGITAEEGVVVSIFS